LGGGGTDLPSYYLKKGGFVLSAAIDKYVYTSVTKPFQKGIYLKYSSIETASVASEVNHPIIREALKIINLDSPQIEITTVADVPAGTGLGSSGSFTAGLLVALHTHFRKEFDRKLIADLACKLEIEILNEPVGKQDQYISMFGGIREMSFTTDDQVYISNLDLHYQVIEHLEDNLLLFYTGMSRKASSILEDQDVRTKSHEKLVIDNLDFTKELGLKTKEALKFGDMETFADLMNTHWEFKRRRTGAISNPEIDNAYRVGLKNGALGGKLVGAGGGGFLMFYAQDSQKLRTAMNHLGLHEMRFRFDFEGTKVLVS
jgi:D-glycero-alpha-D-manno-heptose-7-phosphate kinase